MAFKIFRRLADMFDLDETDKTAGNVIAVNATEDGYELVAPTAGGGGAPTDATYITQTANGSLSAEQALGSLATGVLKNTTTTGVLSIATEGTDYYKPGGTDVAVADGGTGSSSAAGARTNLGLGTIATQDANNVAITGGSVSGITDVTVADGGTGASTAAGARTNLGTAPLDATYIVQTANSELSGEQALGSLATGIVKNTTTTGVLSIAAEGTDYYKPSGTDVAVADGGTGSSTAAGAATNLGLGTGDSPQFTAVNIGHASDTTVSRASAGDIAVEGNPVYRAGGTDVALADGGTGTSLSDPNADRILFWDDSAGGVTWLTPGTNLTITGTTIDAASGGSGGGTPVGTRIIIVPVNMGWTNVAGTFVRTVDASQQTSVFVQNSSTHALNDEVNLIPGAYFEAGTWDIDLWGIGGTDRAIWTILLNGSSVGTADFYNGTLAYNTKKTITGATIGSSGGYTIHVKAASKNGSSSSYYMDIERLVFTRTA